MLYVVIGAGPVGRTVAEQLAARGDHVRVITRSGSGPQGERIERIAADAGDPAALTPLLAGATAVFHCAHAAYTLAAWQADLPRMEQAVLAAAGDRVVVFPESLYSYSGSFEGMTERSPRTATGGKRGVRTRLLAARAACPTPTVSVAAADFLGPYARNSHAGDNMVVKVLAGRTVRVLGSPDQPHSFTYVPDLAAAMIAVTARTDTWGSVLHAPTGPALTQRQLVAALAAAAGTAPKVGSIPGWVLRVLPSLRELAETDYQVRAPFVLDSRHTETLLGLAPTPLAEQAAATVAWYRTLGSPAPTATGGRRPQAGLSVGR